MALSFRSKPSQFVRDSGTGNTLTSYLVCTTLSCDENSYKHDKQTRLDFRRSLVSGLTTLPEKSSGEERRLLCWAAAGNRAYKQTSSSEVRTTTVSLTSCIKVRFSSPESIMEDLPFFCGWGWEFSLSLEKEFEGAAGAILRWISFELWNSLDMTQLTARSCPAVESMIHI